MIVSLCGFVWLMLARYTTITGIYACYSTEKLLEGSLGLLEAVMIAKYVDWLPSVPQEIRLLSIDGSS